MKILPLVLLLFFFLPSNAITSDISLRKSQFYFKVSEASIDGINVTKALKKVKAYSVFYYENGILNMANVWKRANSKSFGPIELKHQHKFMLNRQKGTVYFFQWNFENSYDTHSGETDVTLVKMQESVKLYIGKPNKGCTIYEGVIRGDFGV